MSDTTTIGNPHRWVDAGRLPRRRGGARRVRGASSERGDRLADPAGDDGALDLQGPHGRPDGHEPRAARPAAGPEPRCHALDTGAGSPRRGADAGLVDGWAGDHWGHHYAVDAGLATALSGDYDMLVVPGGQRALDKLMLTAHTKRFVNGFLVSDKPVVMFGDALHLLITTDKVRGRTVAGPETMKDVVAQAGGTWSETTPVRDGVLVTGASDDATRKAMIVEMVDFFGEHATMRRDAAAAAAVAA